MSSLNSPYGTRMSLNRGFPVQRAAERRPARLAVRSVLQDLPPSRDPGNRLEDTVRRFAGFVERDMGSLSQRIASGEFSQRRISSTTEPLRKTLASMGPIGRSLSYQIAQLCRKRLQAKRTTLPEATGSLAEMTGKPFFEPLYELFLAYGPIFKLSFGPKSFVVVSDPAMTREILSTSAEKFSKGILSDILEFVMGNGLIPANGEIWIQRRRAIVPSLHKAFIENMIHTFTQCTERGLKTLEASVHRGESIEMESFFSRLALDIIGRAVFNYDFDATTHDDPVIQAVYTVLREAEKRSMAAAPWWKLPFVNVLIPRQRAVKAGLLTINETLNRLVQSVHEQLDQNDSFDTSTKSILHFLIASGEIVSAEQLRDDLMTLLIAGHETTAAVLTWTFHELSKKPEIVKAMQQEIDQVIGDAPVTSATLFRLDLCTRVIAEAMRLYPQPPVLIRRALDDVTVGRYRLSEGTDIFLSVWNLHRSPALWENPTAFDPDRFPKNAGLPNEISTNFSYIPFGGGKRKCIGAQFALLESLEIVASILRKYDFSIPPDAPEVHLTTGATIHSTQGLYLKFQERTTFAQAPPAESNHPEQSRVAKCPYHT